MNSIESSRAWRVLVLLASYNGQKWIKEQIESILSQKYVDVRLLVIDDVSRDSTAKFILTTWGDDPRVRLFVRNKSSGSAGANFRQMFRDTQIADAQFVALADQDDIWMPTKLCQAIQALNNTGTDGYSGAVKSFWEDGSESIQAQNPKTRKADFLFEGAGQGCTFVLRSNLFMRVQQFCLDHSEATNRLHYHDWLIYLLARAWKAPWYFDTQPLIKYRQHNSNEIGSRGGGIKSAVKRLGLIKNGWYTDQIKAAIGIFRLIDPANEDVEQLANLLEGPRTPLRAVLLALFCFRHGRRRVSDRFAMILMSCLGWL